MLQIWFLELFATYTTDGRRDRQTDGRTDGQEQQFPTRGGIIITNLEEDALVEEAVFLGGHDEVVCLVLVVDDVLEVDSCRRVEVFEESVAKQLNFHSSGHNHHTLEINHVKIYHLNHSNHGF